MKKQIINVDTMKVIGYFDDSETEEKLEELEAKGWIDPCVDYDGDITVWED